KASEKGMLETKRITSLLTRSHCHAEDVVLFSVVVSELELRNIEWQVLAADLMESADHAALNQGPEALDGLNVDDARDIFASGVRPHGGGKVVVHLPIGEIVVCADQADFVRAGFGDELPRGAHLDIFDDAGDDVALASYSASDGRLARVTATNATAG